MFIQQAHQKYTTSVDAATKLISSAIIMTLMYCLGLFLYQVCLREAITEDDVDGVIYLLLNHGIYTS